MRVRFSVYALVRALLLLFIVRAGQAQDVLKAPQYDLMWANTALKDQAHSLDDHIGESSMPSRSRW